MQVKTDTSQAPLALAKNSPRPEDLEERRVLRKQQHVIKGGPGASEEQRSRRISSPLTQPGGGVAVYICSRYSHLLWGAAGDSPPTPFFKGAVTKRDARTPHKVAMATKPSAGCALVTLVR